MDAATKARYLARMKELKTQYYIPSWVAKEIVTLEDIAATRPAALTAKVNAQLARRQDGNHDIWQATEPRVSHLMDIASGIVDAHPFVTDYISFCKQQRSTGQTARALLHAWRELGDRGSLTALYIQSIIVARQGAKCTYASEFLTNPDACYARQITKRKAAEEFADHEEDNYTATVDVLASFFDVINSAFKGDLRTAVPPRAEPMIRYFRSLRDSSEYGSADKNRNPNDVFTGNMWRARHYDMPLRDNPPAFEKMLSAVYTENKHDWLESERSACLSAGEILKDAQKDMVDNRLEFRRQVAMVAIDTASADYIHHFAKKQGIPLEAAIMDAVSCEDEDVLRCVRSDIKFLVRYISK